MKKLLFTIIILVLSISTQAQAPEKFQYQTVVRDNAGVPIANQSVAFRISIHAGSASGPLSYVEDHSATTNDFGLANLVIGDGAVFSGLFNGIDWSTNQYFIEVALDANGGSNYVSMGTTQLLSVPYALNAKKVSDMQMADLTNVAGTPAIGQILKWDGTNWIPQSDSSANYTAGTGIAISGSNQISADLGTSIATSEIQNNAVTNAKIANNAVNTAQIANGAVTAAKVDQMSATSGEVLKWNGSNWAPAADNAGSSVWNLSGSDAYYNAGDVGIGTSSPSAKLEVSQNSSLSDPHIHLHENGNDYSRINFDNNNGSNYWTIAAYIATNNINDRLNFWNGTSGDLMSLTGDGRLGLGVGISPKTALHVKNDGAVLFGTDTIGAGDKLLWLPRKHSFRVGTVAIGAAANYWHPDSMGLYSFASGLNTRAQGFGATAMGRDTEASNSYAFASGFFSNADGQYSTAMGFNTDADALGSTALGYSTDAEANYSFAAGYFAEAQAIYSVALGNAVRAQSYASMAVGRYNVGGGSATTWVNSDPIFEVGIGTGPASRANAITVRKNGNVGIGTTVPLDALQVNGRVRFQTVEYFEDGGTSEIEVRGDLRPSSDNIYDIGTSGLRWDDVYATNGTINTSDRRDKTNIRDLPYGLKNIMALHPVVYQWSTKPEQGDKLGLIAQELLLEIPEVVKTFDFEVSEEDESLSKVENERLGVYYSDLIPVLIKAIQEQQEEIEKLRNEVNQLKAIGNLK